MVRLRRLFSQAFADHGREGALDGLRGAAVLLVLLHHATLLRFHGGFLGVDVFFVLSGLLITDILLRMPESGTRYSFSSFYRRRVHRLLPAALVFVLLVLALRVYSPEDPTGRSFNAAALLWCSQLGNFFINSGYQDLGPFTHTWSLAIEEQFYLLWPVALVLLHRHDRLWQVLAGAVLLVGLTRVVVAAVFGHQIAYFLTPTRADGLLLGCLVSIVLADRRLAPALLRWARLGVALAAVVLMIVVIAVATPQAGWLYAGGLSAFVVATAVLVSHLRLHPNSGLGWILSFRPLQWLGRISYGVYLFSYPISVTFHGDPGEVTISGTLKRTVVPIVLGTLSYVMIEAPVLRRSRGSQTAQCPVRVASDT